jgi:hypothetical protein
MENNVSEAITDSKFIQYFKPTSEDDMDLERFKMLNRAVLADIGERVTKIADLSDFGSIVFNMFDRIVSIEREDGIFKVTINMEPKEDDKPIVLEWEFDNPETQLSDELTLIATAFIEGALSCLNNPAEFGYNSVEFNDEFIFISRNHDTQVFRCYVGW